MRIKFVILFLFLSINLFATNTPHYWKYDGSAANNNWATAGNWYSDAGCTTLIGSVPATTDDAIFNSNSIGDCNLSATTNNCYNLITTGYPAAFTGGALRVYGTVITLGAALPITLNTYTPSGTIAITTNGYSIASLNIGFNTGCTATVQAQDALIVTGTLTLTRGGMDAHGYHVTANTYVKSAANTCYLDSSVPGGMFETSGTSITPWNISDATNYSVSNPTNFSLKVSGLRSGAGAMTCKFGGKTYGNIEWASAAQTNNNDTIIYFVIADANTFGTFKIDHPRKYLFTGNITTTVSSFVASGTSSIYLRLRSTDSNKWTLNCTGANICSDYLRISNSTLNMTAPYEGHAGSHSKDDNYVGATGQNAGNTGWTFTSCLSTSPYYYLY